MTTADDDDTDPTTCHTDDGRRDALRATLRGMARRRGTALALAGAYLLEHGELARIALRGRPEGQGRHLLTALELRADSYLERCGLPESEQLVMAIH